MPLPVQMFPALTPAQINPVAVGLGQANQLYAQGVQNQFLEPNMQAALRKQQLANQITQAQANVAPQMNAAQLAYAQAKTPNLNAATQFLLSGQIPEAQAQAAFIGTNAAKNQFNLANPATMLTGFPQQIGELSVLRGLDPTIFGNNQTAAPTSDQNTVNNINSGVPFRIPGMPSAGPVSSSGQQQNSPILPPNPYGTPQNPAAGADLSSGKPTFEDAQDILMKAMLAQPMANIARAKYYSQQASGFAYKTMPSDAKSYAIAQLAGMGIDPTQASQYLSNGGTIQEAAQQRGLNPDNLPTPLYAATPSTVQLIQRRNQALNEINTIQPEITSAIAPYSRQFAGYSPSQIASAMKNDNPDQQSRFLAARALMPEMASLRLKAMGGNIGIEAIKEVNNQSMGNIKSFQGLVSPKVYTAAQNYVDQWINQGANAANKVGLAGSVGNLNNGGQPLSNATMTGAAKTAAPSGMITMKAPDGNLFHIPASNLQAALKMGAVQQ